MTWGRQQTFNTTINIVQGVCLWFLPGVLEIPIMLTPEPGESRFGMDIKRTEEGFICIHTVAKGSAADRAGLRQLQRASKLAAHHCIRQQALGTQVLFELLIKEGAQVDAVLIEQMSSDPGISAFPEEDNIFCWKGTITGSKETVFKGTEYKLSLTFPTDYPFKSPKVKFDTTCFHPNVDVYGNICLDILQDKWSSAYDVRTILLSIQSLLGEPNTSSPLNNQAAALWSNQEEYRKMVQKLYKPDT
ncbi:hypothetical protein IFM89_003905 [Coptis chinensis]|uniref:E2 ubiquitin-conjugating enzyme n=1 Tax=Coptis chinensis TaxID=261450 RepID=A0A835IM29_9MAGN|nr:hypothetical protein IFM89_003905 [Coptis chinensis]